MHACSLSGKFWHAEAKLERELVMLHSAHCTELNLNASAGHAAHCTEREGGHAARASLIIP